MTNICNDIVNEKRLNTYLLQNVTQQLHTTYYSLCDQSYINMFKTCKNPYEDTNLLSL